MPFVRIPSPLAADPGQALALAHEGGTLLVTGPAGTGKTTVLMERVARAIDRGVDPEGIALVVRTRHARAAVRTALLERLARPLPGLRVVTVHALANQVVGRRLGALGRPEPPRILSSQEQFEAVAELLEGESPADWPAYGAMLGSPGFADEVRQFLSRAQEALLSPDEVRARALAAERTGFLELAGFYDRYLDVLDERNAVDFAGLVRLAATAAEAGRSSGSLWERLLVDDYQDATYATELLIARLAAPELVLAGDPGSHVLSFQGTTDVPLRRAAETFPGLTRVALGSNHRAPGGVRIDAWCAAHPSEEHAALARELRRAHVEEGVAWDQFAVVVRRTTSELGGLLRALDDAGVPRSTPERGVWLLAEPAARPFVLALRWIARPAERDGLVEPLLTSELVGLSPASARALVRAALTVGAAPAAALEMAADAEGLTEEERGRVRPVRDALAAGGRAARSALDAFRALWPGLPLAQRLVEAAERSARGRRDLAAVVTLAEALTGAADGADASVAGFLDALEAAEAGPGVELDREGGGAVPVLTAHATAGREFEMVAIVGALEGDFPSLARPEPMFDLATLDERPAQSEINRRRLEDERRLFDLVIGRARRRVLLTVTDAAGGGGPARSRFAGERGLSWAPVPPLPGPEPVTTAEAAALWRRILADRRRPAPDRLAALEGILSLGVDPGDWWFQRGWTASADDWFPTGEVRTSYSRLSAFENCRLQYALGHELGLEGPSGYQAWAGSLVHGLIEDVEAGAVPRDLDAMLAEVDLRWDPGRFPSRAVSETFRRLVATRMLPAWMETYGAAPALATELEFGFEFDGARVHGFIDRVGPVDGGGCQITDYKTGSGGSERAEDNLQLGIYYLGVEETPELRQRFGPVRAVELVFLKEPQHTRRFRTQLSLPASRADEYGAQTRQRLAGLLAELRSARAAGSFPANASADCRWCDFATLCSRWPEGQDVFPAPNGAGVVER